MVIIHYPETCQGISFQAETTSSSWVKREFRLRRSDEIMRVRRSGKMNAHPLLTLFVSPTDHYCSRIAIIVGKNVGNAVTRNRTKRRLRTIVEAYVNEVEGIYDIVLVSRPGLSKCTYQEAYEAVGTMFQKANITNPSGKPNINGSQQT